MENNMQKPHHESQGRIYSVSDFLPLIMLFTLIIGITLVHQYFRGWHMHDAMRIFMGSFFLIFGFFKVINLKGFAQAYSMYDVISKKIFAYGYVYPFLEIGLGLAYLFSWQLWYTNLFTFVLMSISAFGVFLELKKGKTIVCACLGAVFKVPMTYVTLLEDLLMAAMALWMMLVR